MLKRIRPILYCALVVFCVAGFSTPARSAPTIDVKNAEGKQGEIVKVRVEIDFEDLLPEGVNSINLHLTYINTRLSFRGVTGGTAVGGCTSPSVVETPLNEASGIYGSLTITCDDIQRSNDNAAFDLEFLVLAGPDTTALVESRTITLNGDTLQNSTSSPGIVRFTGDEPLVFPTYPEGLGLNYPNPFNVETKIFYSIESLTPVHFKIFDHLGKLVFEDRLDEQERGPYSYTISPFGKSEWVSWERSSGLYLLVMETNSGTYRQTIMYLK